jgi:hypothetical protein
MPEKVSSQFHQMHNALAALHMHTVRPAPQWLLVEHRLLDDSIIVDS